jgi:hypothetical protein
MLKKKNIKCLDYFNSAKQNLKRKRGEYSEITLNEAKVYIQMKDYTTAKSLWSINHSQKTQSALKFIVAL